MSEPTDTTNPQSTPEAGKGRCNHQGRHGRKGWRRWAKGALFVGFLVGVPWAVANAASGHGFGHGCGKHDAPQSAEELRERMDRGAGWLLNRVDATPEQEAQVDTVLDRVAPELFALKDDHEALRQDLRAALTAESIDAAEVESIRKEGLALADDASRIVVGGIVDIAKVLDVDQRADLAQAAERFHR
mgnify:CR=1 FL=1